MLVILKFIQHEKTSAVWQLKDGALGASFGKSNDFAPNTVLRLSVIQGIVA